MNNQYEKSIVNWESFILVSKTLDTSLICSACPLSSEPVI